jgi:hypothetical protein
MEHEHENLVGKLKKRRKGKKIEGAATHKRLDRPARRSGGRLCRADGGSADKGITLKAADLNEMDRVARQERQFNEHGNPGIYAYSSARRNGASKDAAQDAEAAANEFYDKRAGGNPRRKGGRLERASGGKTLPFDSSDDEAEESVRRSHARRTEAEDEAPVRAIPTRRRGGRTC